MLPVQRLTLRRPRHAAVSKGGLMLRDAPSALLSMKSL